MAAYRQSNAATQEEVISSLSFYSDPVPHHRIRIAPEHSILDSYLIWSYLAKLSQLT
jgi:hypothetical protein